MRIIIVEDNACSASMLRECAESEGFEVVDAFSCGEDLLRALDAGVVPDLLLLDLGLPGISGIELTRRVKAAHPQVEVIIQTVFEDPDSILGAIRAGASGYLLKTQAFTDLKRAVDEVMAGGSSLSPLVARRVLLAFQPPEPRPENPFQLTAREREILDELVAGSPCKTIADRLGISLHTVNNHLRKVYEKMRVDSRAAAVARVMEARRER